MNVVYLGRRPVPGRHFSIERVFSAVAAHLPDGIESRTVEVPRSGAGVRAVLSNVRAARRVEADVVHVTGDVHYVVPFLRKRSTTVLTIHDLASLARTRGLRNRVLRFLWYTWPLRTVDLVTTVSAETKRQLLDEFPGVADKTVVVGNPLASPFSEIEPRPPHGSVPGTPPRVLTIGAGANKNLVRIAEAAKRCGFSLRLIGRLDPGTVEGLASTGVVFDSAHSLTEDELLAEFLAADVLAFVSLHEGFGLPIVEAQAVGLPVVTSDRPPMSDVAAGGAVLVDPMDVNAIGAGLTAAVTNRDLRSDLRSAGLRNVRRHLPGAVAREYADLYRAGRNRRGVAP